LRIGKERSFVEGSSIRELQLALLEMLKDIDVVCKKNNIKYSLSSGTLIGAIRHKGFIPWDDDLDLMFTRAEYDKFIKVAEDVLSRQGYTVQKEFTSEWPMTYSKIRKDNSAYIEDFKPKIKNIHQGIFIDIFPIDNMMDNKLMGRVQWIAYRLLLAKQLGKRGYTTKSFIKKLATICTIIVPEKLVRKMCIAEQSGASRNLHCFLGGALFFDKSVYPREAFDEYISVPFEDSEFLVIKGYEEYLRICYGDYMKLPSEEERVATMHAKLIDVNTSYKKYISSEKGEAGSRKGWKRFSGG
jgi:lipopolysaccharide cholinephosphotransferase